MNQTLETIAPRAVGLLCPTCQTGLVMSERQNIEIDYCPTCRGVWLDRGELDKIIERSAAEVKSARMLDPVQPQTRSTSHGRHGPREYDDHGLGRRRKSWLQELFD